MAWLFVLRNGARTILLGSRIKPFDDVSSSPVRVPSAVQSAYTESRRVFVTVETPCPEYVVRFRRVHC